MCDYDPRYDRSGGAFGCGWIILCVLVGIGVMMYLGSR